MKTRPDARGIALVECLVYFAVTSIIMGLALEAFFRCQTNSRDLGRNVNDMARVLQAGETWRQDIRSATGQPKAVRGKAGPELHIPQEDGEAVYLFSKETIWRKTVKNRMPSVFLQGVKASDMIMDKREEVTSWRWEVELISIQKTVRICPMFTFQAVANIQS